MSDLLGKIVFESLLVLLFLIGARRAFAPTAAQNQVEQELSKLLRRAFRRQAEDSAQRNAFIGYLNLGCALFFALFLVVDIFLLVQLLFNS
jgi:hypothetical protein